MARLSTLDKQWQQLMSLCESEAKLRRESRLARSAAIKAARGDEPRQ